MNFSDTRATGCRTLELIFRMFRYLCPEGREQMIMGMKTFSTQNKAKHTKQDCKHSHSGHGEEKKIRKNSVLPKTGLRLLK
jgi:hypothetical protein